MSPDIHSLTRVVTVRHHWIHPFVAGVRESVTTASSFRVDLSGFEVFVNEEGTRTFVGLRAISGMACFPLITFISLLISLSQTTFWKCC